jgi:tetratricopeptide (TPR) repeat protein
MKKLLPLFLGLLVNSACLAQIKIQEGKVRELNSKKTPIEGVQILFSDAKATESDVKGDFQLRFQDKQAGDIIFKEQIYKKGYELVNEHDFDILKISSTSRLGVDIILATEGTVDAAKQEYYDVSFEALENGYKRRINGLRKQLSQKKISNQEYEQKSKQLQKENYRLKASLDTLADKFARVNFDDVAPFYEEALQLFKKGEIDKAIEVLEGTDPQEKTRKILEEQKRIKKAKAAIAEQEEELNRQKKDQIENLRLLADMYNLKFDPEKAEIQFDQLLALDSTDLDILSSAAAFFYEQHLYTKALDTYQKIRIHPEVSDWQKANAASFLGGIYTNIGQLEQAMESFKMYSATYQQLSRKDTSSFYKSNLAISYSKLGSTHTSLGNLEKALDYFERRSQLGQELYDSYPTNVSFKNGLAISYFKLGNFYNVQLKHSFTALSYFEQAEHHWLELVKIAPQFASFKQYLNIVQGEIVKIKYNNLIEFNQKISETQDTFALYQLYTRYCDTLRQKADFDEIYRAELSSALNSRAWYGLFLGKFEASESDIREGLQLKLENKYLHTNLAPALLLQGKFELAKTEYMFWKDKLFDEERSYKELFLSDIMEFEQVGIIPESRRSDIEKIKALLRN